ncbi:MAG: arylesterase [Gemmatimonadota bacterium]
MRQIIIGLTILALTACRQDRAADAGALSGASDTIDAPPASVPAAPGRPDHVVLFIGTSITAGYGIGEEFAYPAVIQQMIDSAGLPYRVSNAGVSGETSAGGLRRIDWALQQPIDVLVVELGANDGLRGLPVADMRADLDSLLSRARARYPDVRIVLLGMEAPPNLGEAYTTAFRSVFPELAARHDAALVPFVLDSVVADRSLNIEDGVHPNPAGHRIIARNVWRALGPVLRAHAAQRVRSDSS